MVSSITDTAWDVLEYALLIITALCLVASITTSLTYPWRWLVLRIKTFLNQGYRVWRIAPDGRMSRSQNAPDDFRKATMSLLDELSSGERSIIRPKKATSSFIARNAPEEEGGGTELFLLVDKFHADANVVKRWANAVNCEATEPETMPDIIGHRSVILSHDSYQPTKVSLDVSMADVGKVIAGMQSQSDYKSCPGAVVLTFEGMSAAETNRFRNDAINQYRNIDGHSGFDKVKLAMDDFAADPQRASMVAMADSGDPSDSFALLKSASSNVQTAPMDFLAADPLRNYVLSIEPFKFLMWSVPGFLGYFLTGNTAFLAMSIAMIALMILRGTPALTTWFIDPDTRKGLVALPPFFRFSPRRMLKDAIWAKRTVNEFGDKTKRLRTAPAPKTIIPMYPTPIIEFATMPQDMKSTNSVKSKSPVIGFSTSLESLYKCSDDYLFNGFSSAGQKFGRRLDTIQWGSCWGGTAGSGKTNGLMLDYYFMAKVNAATDGPAKDFRITPTWLETKGEGAHELAEMVKEFDPILIDVHNPDSEYRLAIDGTRVDLDDPHGNDIAYSYAVDFTNSLIEALGATSVGPRASNILRNVHFLSCRLSNAELEHLGLGKVIKSGYPNLISLDYYLAGGDPGIMPFKKMKAMSEQFTERCEQLRGKIGDSLKAGSSKDSDEVRKMAISIARMDACSERLNALAGLNDNEPMAFGAVTNKLSYLRMSDGMFTPGPNRKDVTVGELIKSFRPVIINMGGIQVGFDEDGHPAYAEPPVGDRGARELLSAFHYLLWTRIKKSCTGWLASKKFIPIYADEVSDIVSFDPESLDIIMQVRDQGRSKGCSHNVGFQTFGQMPPKTVQSILSFSTRYLMRFEAPDDISKIAESFNDTSFTDDMISSWPVGAGVARLTTAPNEFSNKFVFTAPLASSLMSKMSEYGGDTDSAIDDIKEDIFS